MNKTNYKFTPKYFRELLVKQDYKCMLSSREITVENVEAEHIKPLSDGGKHEPSNICLIIEPLRELKRYYSEEYIYELAKDIVKTYEAKNKKRKPKAV